MADSDKESALESLLGDRYTREARLAPAFLSFFPILLLLLNWFGNLNGVITDILTLLGIFGVVRWISHISRGIGDRKEVVLFARWRGKPSTTMLRRARGFTPLLKHEDDRQIAHILLEALPGDEIEHEIERRNGVRLPAQNDDDAIVNNADLSGEQKAARLDRLYEPVVTWLRESTRMVKLVAEEEISYGFQRNFFALREFALFSGAIALVGQALVIYAGWSQESAPGLPHVSPLNIVIFLAIVAYMAGVARFVSEDSVKVQGFDYARQLISSVFSIPLPDAMAKESGSGGDGEPA